eukprot:scaffold3.g6217.t1
MKRCPAADVVDLTSPEAQAATSSPLAKRAKRSGPSSVVDLTSDDVGPLHRRPAAERLRRTPRPSRRAPPLARLPLNEEKLSALVESTKADEALARRLQDEEDRRVVQAEAALQRRMDALERAEEDAEAAGHARFGFGGRRVSLSRRGGGFSAAGVAAATAGPVAAARAGLDALGQGHGGRATGPRSARRRAGRWADGLGYGMFGGGPLLPQLSAFQHAMAQVVGGTNSGLPPQLLFSDRDFGEADYELLLRLDEKVESKKGASRAAVEALATFRLPAGGGAACEADACCICLEEPRPGDKLCRLPCHHTFHAACIQRWLLTKAVCPVCQRPSA